MSLENLPTPIKWLVLLGSAYGAYLATSWAICEPHFESILTASGSFGFFLLQIWYWWFRLPNTSASSNVNKSDVKLFKEFQIALPSGSAIWFLDNHNFAGYPFHTCYVDELHAFLEVWDKTEKEFIDEEVESAKIELYQLIEDFVDVLSNNSEYMQGKGGCSSVALEWETNCPVKFKEITDKVNTLARGVAEKYVDFVRFAKKRLSVKI